MVEFIFLLQAAQDGDRVFHRRFANKDGLEAAFQRGVLLHMLAIFFQRGRADAVQLTAGERRLEQVGSVHGAFRLAGAHQRVHFIDEQHDIAAFGAHFVEHAFQPFFELAAVFRPSDQRAHVQRHQPLVFQAIGHVAIGDAQGQAFGNRGLAHAGFTDQHRVVLGAAGEHLDGAADFLVTADHRIKLASPRRLGQVAGIFLQRIKTVFGAGRISRAALADAVDGFVQRLRGDAGALQRLAGFGGGGERQRNQQPFDGDNAVAGLHRHLLGGIEHAHRIIVPRQALRAAARYLGDLGQRLIGELQCGGRRAASRLDQAGSVALLIFQQGFQHMFGRHALVVVADCNRLRRLQEPLGAIGEFFDVHGRMVLLFTGGYGVALWQHK